MDKKRVSVFFALLAVFALSFLLLFSDFFVKPGPPKIYHISMITRGKSSGGWASIREGAAMAADERNVELSFILLGEENDAAEQAALLERECEAGVDALLVSAADSAAIGGAIRDLPVKVPVISFESPAEESLSYVSADNYAMGMRLGHVVLEQEHPGRVALLEYGGACRHIRERMTGLLSVLGQAGIKPVRWKLPEKSDDIPGFLVQKLSARDADTLIALDFVALEQAAQFAEGFPNYNSPPQIYGIGTTDRILFYLEQGTISGIVVQNDFAMGYLSVQAAMDAITGRTPQEKIPVEYRLVTGRTMYDKGNQSLLFPFIR